MPRLSDKTREQRRQHILTSAWRCFSRDGFHATRVAVQTWAQALRDPRLHGHARARCRNALDHIVELAMRWREAGHIPAEADTKAVAATIFSLMHGLIVMHHLVENVPADVLLRGVSSLGAAADSS